MPASQVTKSIPEIDEEQIPVEGEESSDFRRHAGYVWTRLKDIAVAFNIFRTQLNVVVQEVNDNAVQVADDKTFVAEAKTVVTQTMAAMPDGTINDITPSTTSTYSSEKIEELKEAIGQDINELQNNKADLSSLVPKADITYVDNEILENRVFTPLNINKMLTGTFSMSNTMQQVASSVYIYTGDATARDIVTGMDMKSNWEDYSALAFWTTGTYNTDDEVYILDSSSRKIRVVCLKDGVTSNPNDMYDFTIDTAVMVALYQDWKIESKTFGGAVATKSRTGTASSHQHINTLMGASKVLFTDQDAVPTTSTTRYTKFNINGFSIGTALQVNEDTSNFVSWSDQTTFIESFITEHNKPAIRETNVVSGYAQILHKGSGQEEHIVKTGLNRKSALRYTKRIDAVGVWLVRLESFGKKTNMQLNLNNAKFTTSGDNYWGDDTQEHISFGSSTVANTNDGVYLTIVYTNSFVDANGVLHGNYEIGTYKPNGSPLSINAKKSINYALTKPITVVLDWTVTDIFRNTRIEVNTPDVEAAAIGEIVNGVLNITNSSLYTSGQEYFYLLKYDDGNTGTSLYDQPTDTTQLQLTDGVLSVSNGYNSDSGVNNEIKTFSGTIMPTNGWED